MAHLRWTNHPPTSLYHVALSDLIDQHTRLIIRWLISQTVLQPPAQTWALPCGRGSFAWCVPFLFIWVWFYWIDSESALRSFCNHSLLQRASAHHCDGTYPGRRHHQNRFWVSYKRPHHQKGGIGLRGVLKNERDWGFSLFLPAECCVLHRPLADVFSKRQ